MANPRWSYHLAHFRIGVLALCLSHVRKASGAGLWRPRHAVHPRLRAASALVSIYKGQTACHRVESYVTTRIWKADAQILLMKVASTTDTRRGSEQNFGSLVGPCFSAPLYATRTVDHTRSHLPHIACVVRTVEAEWAHSRDHQNLAGFAVPRQILAGPQARGTEGPSLLIYYVKYLAHYSLLRTTHVICGRFEWVDVTQSIHPSPLKSVFSAQRF